MLRVLPKAGILWAGKSYDADWFRDALAERKIDACDDRRLPPLLRGQMAVT